MADRQCEVCGAKVPHRMSRTRNEQGQMACEECIKMTLPVGPGWTAAMARLPQDGRDEVRRRTIEALVAVQRVLQRTAHDSGDNAIINHCPFCGSGAVVGGSSGNVSCDFCHTNFTVQVQPAHTFMPQTIDGQPITPPGMPGEAPTEMSAPLDPAINETDEGVVADPVADPMAEVKQEVPPQFAKGAAKTPKFCPRHTYLAEPGSQVNVVSEDDCDVCGDEKDPHEAHRVASPVSTYLCDKCGHYRTSEGCDYCETVAADSGHRKGPGLLDYLMHGLLPSGSTATASFRTDTGETLDMQAYMARLALEHADDRGLVLDAVRHENAKRAEAAASTITCPNCKGSGVDPKDGFDDCPDCKGTGMVEVKIPGVTADLLNPSTGIDDNDRDLLAQYDTPWDEDLLLNAGRPVPAGMPPTKEVPPWLRDERGGFYS